MDNRRNCTSSRLETFEQTYAAIENTPIPHDLTPYETKELIDSYHRLIIQKLDSGDAVAVGSDDHRSAHKAIWFQGFARYHGYSSWQEAILDIAKNRGTKEADELESDLIIQSTRFNIWYLRNYGEKMPEKTRKLEERKADENAREYLHHPLEQVVIEI